MASWRNSIYDYYTGSLTQYYGWRVINKTRVGSQWSIDIFNDQTSQKQTLHNVGNLSLSQYSDNSFFNGPEVGKRITKIAIGGGDMPKPKSMITPKGVGKVTVTQIEW